MYKQFAEGEVAFYALFQVYFIQQNNQISLSILIPQSHVISCS